MAMPMSSLTALKDANKFLHRQKGNDSTKDPQANAHVVTVGVLVKTIKRSILCIQREQYDKAEQMLHLALRMAQDIQSKDGITYVFDLMANLAMEREQFKKAEKIFTDVMKRLFADGHTEESPKVGDTRRLLHQLRSLSSLDTSHQLQNSAYVPAAR